MTTDPIDTAHSLFRILEDPDVELAKRIVAPDNHNVTASASPVACRTPGPAGTLASSVWLRSAFPDLSFHTVEALAEGDRVWLRLRMRGTHTGPLVRFDDDVLDQVVPPTGRSIDVEQTHLIHLRDGQVIKHEAVRDDLAMLEQLGVFPPGPAVLRMAVWKLTGKAKRAAQRVSKLTADAADQLQEPLLQQG